MVNTLTFISIFSEAEVDFAHAHAHPHITCKCAPLAKSSNRRPLFRGGAKKVVDVPPLPAGVEFVTPRSVVLLALVFVLAAVLVAVVPTHPGPPLASLLLCVPPAVMGHTV